MHRASTAGAATRARYLEPRGIRRSKISRQVLKPTGPDNGAIVKRSLDAQADERARGPRARRVGARERERERRDVVIRMH